MSKEPGCLSLDMMVSHPSGVSASSHHAQVAGVEGDGVLDLTRGDVHLDRIVNLDDGVRVSDGPAVSGVEVGHSVGSNLDLPHLAQLVLRLLSGDPVHREPALHVVDDTEVFSSFLYLDDIHEPSWELWVSADLAVNLDEPLLQNGLDLLGGQSVLQTVPDEQSDGE